MPVPGQFFDLDRVDGERLRHIAERLRSIGYTERGVRKRLGLSRLSDLRLESYPTYEHDRLIRREPLDIAISLFLLQGVVAVEQLELLLDRDDRRALKDAGILLGQKSTRTYRAAVSLYPQRDILVFTDHRFAHLPWVAARRPRDPVDVIGAQSHALMRSTIRRPVRSALEIGCGAGFQAIYTANFAERVIGTDCSARAVNFARLNAIFNNTWNVSFAESDLFDAVRGERFDYISALPPSAPSPGYELRSRDGGPSGADVLRRIIAGIPDFLNAGGYAQVATYVGEREGEPYLERIRRWLTGANMNIHALRVEELDIDAFAVAQVSKPFESDYNIYTNDLRRWVDNLRTQRFKRILNVILTFEWNDDRAMPPWTQEDEVKPPRRSIGEDILQLFKSRQRTRRSGAARELDHCIVGVPDDIILAKRRVPSGSGFVTKDYRVTWRDPALSPELEIKPLVCDLLELVDNRRTVPEIIQAYANARNVPLESIETKARQAFLAMFERGLITLDRAAGSPSRSEAGGQSEFSSPDLLNPDAIPELDGILPEEVAQIPSVHSDPLAAPSSGALPAVSAFPGGSYAPPPGVPGSGRQADPFHLSQPSEVNPAVAPNRLSQPSEAVQRPRTDRRSETSSEVRREGRSSSSPLGAMAALAAAAEEESKRAPSSQHPNPMQTRNDDGKPRS